MSAGNDPGAMRKLPIYFGVVEDDHQHADRYSDEYGTVYVYDWSARERSLHPDESVSEDPDEQEPLEELFGAVFDLADQIASRIGPDEVEARLRRTLREATLYPRTYNEARTIGEHFRQGTPVIMNLTEMADSDAKRLVDFSAGLIFGLRGSIERVTNKVFLLSPANVE
jgi:cell division inhibitor SepF